MNMAGVPAKSGLSPSVQRDVIWWLAKGHGIEDAARRAGLPSSAALYRLKRTTAFADDLRAALRDRLGTELAPKAIKILEEIMSDANVSARVRVDAAKAILDRGGFSAAESAADAAKPPGDLMNYTVAQLNAIIADCERKEAGEGADEAQAAVDVDALL